TSPPSGLADTAMTAAFVADAAEQLDTLDAIFVRAAHATEDPEDLKTVFRGVHTIKGNAGLLGFAAIERIAHQLESMLGAVRETGGGLSVNLVKAVLPQLDLLRNEVRAISAPEPPSRGDVSGMSMPPLSMPPLSMPPPSLPPPSLPPPSRSSRSSLHPNDPPSRLIGEILIETGAAPEYAVNEALSLQQKTVGEILLDTGVVKADQVERALQIQRDRRPPTAAVATQQNIRVDLGKLDLLMNLVGELVIAETMVTQNPDLDGRSLENFEKASRHLNKIVRDMQDIATSLRMIPVGGSLRKMLRLVHDLSEKQRKDVDLLIVGEDTEVDKTVTELIADPLVHLLRNGVDHGIETRDERLRSRKSPRATIRLEAKHQGGEVLIIVEDDGRGLDRDKILAKARENGLVAANAPPMSDSDVFRLIFEPGFSTAEKVTDVSGRGVGMDVVQRNIEKLRGRVDINSVLGRGTTVTLRIPLTLAIIEGMLVRVGRRHYTIPLQSIQESIVPRTKDITRMVDGLEVVRVRDRLIPVLRLHRLHAIRPEKEALETGVLTIVEESNVRIAMFIDELVGQRQTVIKSLPSYLGSIRGVSGCSLLGNGEISLILDVSALVKLGGDELVGKGHAT
ncbi:MAG: chemotaxis protein CheA, partial [Myxococcales bacterium]